MLTGHHGRYVATTGGVRPRLGHRLDPDALLETKPPGHTENLHRLVVANSPAIMADQLQPPVETANLSKSQTKN